MTIPTLNAIGFCAHYSAQGDWAFDFALALSRAHAVPLKVFHFLADPYDRDAVPPTGIAREELVKFVVRKERELRMYYDTRAGDYLDVGFRLCEASGWRELHRCLLAREFQILVLGYVAPDARFAGKPLEEFAESFVSPVVLVGPDESRQFHLNGAAALISDKLGLPDAAWERIAVATG
jgi:hypothetical protein